VQQYKGIVDFGLDRQSKDFGGAIHWLPTNPFLTAALIPACITFLFLNNLASLLFPIHYNVVGIDTFA
jgi:hypothetical protein